MADWNYITLKGDSQVIPKMCPNCLAAATQSRRVSHRFLNTTHWQTFYFCDYCAGQHDVMDALGNWYFLAFIIGLGAAVGAVFGLHPILPEAVKASPAGGLLPFIAGFGAGGVFAWWRRASAFRRFPRTPAQATAGCSAQYIGHGAFGFNFATVRYRALRTEWLRELARLNPDQLSDEDYRRWTGEAKPA